MSREIFGRLRQMLMEQLDLSRELSDKEILDVIDEYIENIILFKHAIKSGNGEVIRTLIRQANKVREVLDKGKK